MLHVSPEATRSDIDIYISSRLQSEYASLEVEVIEKLRRRLSDCNGMFLWVRLMFEELSCRTTISEILQCLDEFPNSLNETYGRIMLKISKHKYQQLLAHKVFFWVQTVRRPVSVAELCTLLAIRRRERKYDKNKCIWDAENMTVSVCTLLLQIKQPGSLVFAVHFTVNHPNL